MDVDRHVQGLGGFKDRPIFLVVQIFVVRVGIDDHAVELQLVLGALDLLGGRGRVLRGNCRKACEATGIARDHFGQLVIGAAGHADRDIRCQQLHAGGGQG